MMLNSIEHFGDNIYHFTSSETALLYILPKLRLKLSSFLESNDPKEYKTFGFWSIFKDCEMFKSGEIEKEFKKYLSVHCKQICFSNDYYEIPEKCERPYLGYNHPTMWSHYASNSKGICFVLNKSKFLETNKFEIFDDINYDSYFHLPQIDSKLWEKKVMTIFLTS